MGSDKVFIANITNYITLSMSRRLQAGKAFDPDLSLSPEQEDLLRVALSSNKPSATLKAKENNFIQALQTPLPRMASSNGNPKHAEQIFDSSSESPDMYKPYNKTSPILGAPAGLDLGESPLLDYDLDDANIDWENAGEDMFGALPGNPNDDDGDLHDKRKNPEAEDEEENGNKRREGDEKSAKKPGRKPLTEPTTVGDLKLPLQDGSAHGVNLETKSSESGCATGIPRAKRAPSKRT